MALILLSLWVVMRPLVTKLKPAQGFAQVFHVGLLVLLPLTVFVLVRLNFAGLAYVVILLSKWRMFAVRPRFWLANIRANAIDIIVGLSVVLFMVHASSSPLLQFIYAVLYAVWQIKLKPASSLFYTSVQAFIGQLLGLMALYLAWSGGPLIGLTLLTGLIGFLAARHFFDSFNEPYARLLAYIWGYFSAGLAWILGHWLLFYRGVAQPTLLLTVLGYGLAVLYYLDHHGRSNKGLRLQFVFVMLAVVIVVLTFSNWGDKIV
jgi:hypothetical protein